MSHLHAHLEHIRATVVPARRAAPGRLEPGYAAELAGRAQPPLLVRGLEQWNAGDFHAQHETLEWLWRAGDEPVRDLWKGILQAGVGAYHALNHNRRGALAKWTGALGYLEPFLAFQPYRVDVDDLYTQVAAARAALLADTGESPDWATHTAAARAMQVRWERREAAPRVTALLRRLDEGWMPGQERAAVAQHEAFRKWLGFLTDPDLDDPLFPGEPHMVELVATLI